MISDAHFTFLSSALAYVFLHIFCDSGQVRYIFFLSYSVIKFIHNDMKKLRYFSETGLENISKYERWIGEMW